MAKGKKTGGRNFPKGNTCGGRKALPEEIRLMAAELKPELIRAYSMLSTMPLAQVDNYKPVNHIEAGILKILKEFARTGKVDQIRHVWDQVHGKPKESIDLTNYSEPDNIIIQVRGVSAEGEDQPEIESNT